MQVRLRLRYFGAMDTKEAKPKPNIYLLGFMGTGKTSVGKRLAQILGFKFIDSDEEIEKKYAMSVRDIFEKFGEEKFRQMEREFVESGHPDHNCVVSCGGGLVCRGDMPEKVKAKGVAIVLVSQPEEIFERVCKNDKRPLLNVPDPLAKIRELLDVRNPYYMRSGIQLATAKEIRNTVDDVLKIYERKTRKKRNNTRKKPRARAASTGQI